MLSSPCPIQRRITGQIDRALKSRAPMDALWRLWQREAAANPDEFAAVLICNLIAARELLALGSARAVAE